MGATGEETAGGILGAMSARVAGAKGPWLQLSFRSGWDGRGAPCHTRTWVALKWAVRAGEGVFINGHFL